MQKALKRPSTLQTPSTSRKLPKMRMLKFDKIEEFAKREKIVLLMLIMHHPDKTTTRQIIT